MTDKNVPASIIKYNCKYCNYFTSRKSQYDRHLTTDKHKKYKNTDNFSSEVPYECECGKLYKHRQSLHSHKKKCNFSENQNLKSHISEDLILQLVKENQDIKNPIIRPK